MELILEQYGFEQYGPTDRWASFSGESYAATRSRLVGCTNAGTVETEARL